MPVVVNEETREKSLSVLHWSLLISTKLDFIEEDASSSSEAVGNE